MDTRQTDQERPGLRPKSPLLFDVPTNPLYFKQAKMISDSLQYLETHGKKVSGMEMQVINRMLSGYGLGYITSETPTPHDAVAYHREESEYNHPWSFHRLMYDYGFYKLNEIFGTPREYLSSNRKLVSRIISSIEAGASARLAREKQNKPKDPLSPEEIMKGFKLNK